MSFTLDLRYHICQQPIDLPVFNPVALELLQLLVEPEIEISDVIALIHRDQALSIQILCLANSSAFAGRNRSETIKESVNRLGTRQIISLAMAASQSSLHISPIPVVNQMMHKLWLHSYSCAIGCKTLAASTGYWELADQAYLAGLLHDVGKLYLLKAMEQICLENQLDLKLDMETLLDVFSDMHIEQGVRIMNFWNIPAIYTGIVINHHVEHVVMDDPLLSIVRLVNFKSTQYGLNCFPRYTEPADSDHEINTLNVTEADLKQLEENMRACGA